MFPPIDDSVLENNPDFAHLYKTLTTVTLNPNGTTRVDPSSKARNTVREELNAHRLKAAKHHLLTSAITTAIPEPPPTTTTTNQSTKPKPKTHTRTTSTSTSTPPTNNSDLPPLLLLLSPLLTNPPHPTVLPHLLASPPLSNLPALLTSLTPLLSQTLQSTALSLARIANPTTNPSYLHRTIPTLPTHHAHLLHTLHETKQSLSQSRLQASALLTSLLRSHVAALSHLVRSLEAKHGVVARSLELRSAEVALDARKAEADARHAAARVRADVYGPDVVAALAAYEAHLQNARMRLEQCVADLRVDLEEYGVGVEGGEGREKIMRELARKYDEVAREMGEVKADLERLGRT